MADESLNGFRTTPASSTPFNVAYFMIRQYMAKVRTATIVKVLAVTNDGGLSPVGSVDIQPLVQQTDGVGNVTALPPVYGVPYMRIQGGTNAVIIDPQVGDLGIALFGDRDLSAVKTTKDMAPPGSSRRNSLADALYIGGLLNGAPVQFVQFEASGITVKSPVKVTIEAPTVAVQGDMTVSGTVVTQSTITASGEVKSGNIGLQAHHHTAQGATAPTTAAQA
jgi:hypothetical protein